MLKVTTHRLTRQQVLISLGLSTTKIVVANVAFIENSISISINLVALVAILQLKTKCLVKRENLYCLA